MCFQSGDGFKALPYMCSPPFMATIPIAKIESEGVLPVTFCFKNLSFGCMGFCRAEKKFIFVESQITVMKLCRKISVSGLLVVIFVLLLSSCGENHNKYVIGVSQCSEDLWRETVNKEMQREISFYPELTIQIKSAKDDTRKQIEDIESFISEGVDLLVVAPNESASITPLIKKAIRKDIPVILLDRKVALNNYTAYVGANNYDLAYGLGKYVANLLHGKGRIVEIRGYKGATADIERHQGFRDAIKQYPDIEVIAECRGDFLRDTARENMDIVLTEHDKIDLVFAMNDQMALGVAEALSKYSSKRPYIVGIDALPGSGGGIEYVGQGIIDASFIYPTGGDTVIETAWRILSGQPYKKDNILNTAVVDRSNVHVIQLQSNQINEMQNKFDKLNILLNKSMMQYANQRALVVISLVISALVILLLFLLFYAYWLKSRTNMQLKRKNEEIQAQAIELEQQKQHLIALSADLEKAMNAKLVFFTNISHELKTPLSLITGPVELLLSYKNESEQFYKLLNLIKRNSNRLLSLISEIIEFRTYENKKMQLQLSRCNLVQFLGEMNDYFTEMANQKHITLELKAEEQDFQICIDAAKIEKVYFNLLSNAFKHVNSHGRIETRLSYETTTSGKLILISVFNTGSFIPQELISEIFIRFYTTDFNNGSTGIGMALTKSIIELHGGSISVESNETDGTTFIIRLPVNDNAENVSDTAVALLTHEMNYTQQQLAQTTVHTNAAAAISLFESSNNPDKPQLLLIEDNPDMLQFLSEVLKDEYTVIKACEGEEGVQKAIKYIPDIIISDVMMPSIDGFTVCHILKEHVSTSHIPIILLTALSIDEQKAIGFERGADAYMSKPFNTTMLRIRIRNLMENRRKIRENFCNYWMQENSMPLVNTERDFINRFNAYVEANLQREELGIEEIAEHLGLSRAQLYRKVKSITNYSPLELVTLTRLRYSRNLMLVGKKSISEAAYASGFTSPAHYTKTFKKYYGESPSDFIKKSKKVK